MNASTATNSTASAVLTPAQATSTLRTSTSSAPIAIVKTSTAPVPTATTAPRMIPRAKLVEAKDLTRWTSEAAAESLKLKKPGLLHKLIEEVCEEVLQFEQEKDRTYAQTLKIPSPALGSKNNL